MLIKYITKLEREVCMSVVREYESSFEGSLDKYLVLRSGGYIDDDAADAALNLLFSTASKSDMDIAFMIACSHGYVEVIRYCLYVCPDQPVNDYVVSTIRSRNSTKNKIEVLDILLRQKDSDPCDLYAQCLSHCWVNTRSVRVFCRLLFDWRYHRLEILDSARKFNCYDQLHDLDVLSGIVVSSQYLMTGNEYGHHTDDTETYELMHILAQNIGEFDRFVKSEPVAYWWAIASDGQRRRWLTYHGKVMAPLHEELLMRLLS